MRSALLAPLFLLTLAAPLSAQATGPAKGSLVVVGGGNLPGTGILERFIDLAGGGDKLIVAIPSAGEDDAYDESWDGLRQLRAAGARRLRVLHTRDRRLPTRRPLPRPSGKSAASRCQAVDAGAWPIPISIRGRTGSSRGSWRAVA